MNWSVVFGNNVIFHPNCVLLCMLCLSEPNLYKFALSLFLFPVKAKNSEDKGTCTWSLACETWWHLWRLRDWNVTAVRSHYKRKLQLSSNSLKIGVSSVTHRVPRIMEGLDAPDGRHYSWLYCDRPPKESIGRTNLFVDCSCIEWNFWKDDLANQLFWSVSKTWFLTLVSRNILCFLLPFFFLSYVQSKSRGAYYTKARIIHG